MSFLDPYERNRRLSLITSMRIALWSLILLIGLAIGWIVW
jgi:hypothetical protein